MTRHTIETVRDTIALLRAQPIVYKVQVDDLKYAFSRAFENDWKTVKDSKYLSKAHDDRTEDETALYFESPFEARHWYGKKFSKFLDELPGSDFKDGAVSHRNRWRPLFLELEELKARQVKGRIPQPKKEVVDTRTQLRAICPCCFKQHAVKNERMVAHGYTLDYGFQNGSCQGQGKKHFGTTEGVQFTQDRIRMARNEAARLSNVRIDLMEGRVSPINPKTGKIIEDPTQQQVRTCVASIENNIRQCEFHAAFLQKQVDGWKFSDPVEVEVEVMA